MLKNVVLPAPLGPMIETIARRGMAKETSLTATRPPKIFDTRSATRMSPFAACSLMPSPRPANEVRASNDEVVAARSCLDLHELLVGPDVLLELHLAPSLGQQDLR